MRKTNSKIPGIKANSPEDSSDLPAQLPFRVSVSDRQAVDPDVWETSGDHATLEEAVTAAKKIVDDLGLIGISSRLISSRLPSSRLWR